MASAPTAGGVLSDHSPEMLELVSVYAVGGIDATTGECAEIRAHIAQCQLCREEFRRSTAAAAAVGIAAAQAPPPALRAKLLSSLPARATTHQRRWSVAWYVPATAAAVLLIVAGVWWKTELAQRQSWTLSCVATATNCHASGAVGIVGSNLVLRIHGLALLPSGKQYQAWMIVPGKAPAPEPAFSPAVNGDGSVSFAGAAAKGALVAVTVEPRGGSSSPTTKPFLIAKIE
jgi:anti-sigma-K factor RskA